MRWVKLTLPPRLRWRWLLMTTRLSMSSLAGTARTLVAVGTARLLSMLVTTRAAGPRSGTVSSSLVGPVGLTAGASRGVGFAASAALGSAGASAGAAGAGAALAGAGAAGTAAGAGVAGAAVAVATEPLPPACLPSVGW